MQEGVAAAKFAAGDVCVPTLGAPESDPQRSCRGMIFPEDRAVAVVAAMTAGNVNAVCIWGLGDR